MALSRDAWILTALVLAHGMNPTRSESQTTYEVFGIQVVDLSERPLGMCLSEADPSETMTGTVPFWLLKGTDGRIVLFDSGFSAEAGMRQGLNLDTYRRPDSSVAQLGFGPNEVSDIIVSHMHWDHVDGLGLFPEARVWIQDAEFIYYSGPAWEAGGDPTGIDREGLSMLPERVEEGRVTFLSGEEAEILDGITVYPGARHSFFSQFISVRTAAGTVVLASDNLCAYANFDRGIPLATTFDTAADLRYFERMKEIASDETLILPGHDRAVFDRFPEVSPGILKIGGQIGAGLDGLSSG